MNINWDVFWIFLHLAGIPLVGMLILIVDRKLEEEWPLCSQDSTPKIPSKTTYSYKQSDGSSISYYSR